MCFWPAQNVSDSIERQNVKVSPKESCGLLEGADFVVIRLYAWLCDALFNAMKKKRHWPAERARRPSWEPTCGLSQSAANAAHNRSRSAMNIAFIGFFFVPPLIPRINRNG
jgi:hypothetical protein